MSANDEQKHRNATDRALVEFAIHGQLQAFCELVERTQALARAVAYSASGDADAVEDLVQEALVTAWTRLPDLSDPSAFRPWLAGIVRNTVRYQRRHQRRHAPRAQAGMDTLQHIADGGPSPLDTAEDKQSRHQASRALQALPRKYREPLLMYYALGESHAQVAEALGMSEASARQRVHRARKKLASEVHRVESAGRNIAGRASAAAAVVALLESKSALAAVSLAAVPHAAAHVATTSPKVFLGLGALGGGAIVASIAALVMLLGGESGSMENARAQQRIAPDKSSPTAPATSNEAEPAVEGTPSAASQGSPEGVVRIGYGKVRDPIAPAVANTKNSDTTSASQNSSHRKKQHGTICKHGPAQVALEEDTKTLLQPDIDMQAVSSEMWP